MSTFLISNNSLQIPELIELEEYDRYDRYN